MKDAPRTKRVAPRASILIESMRDIGYSLHTAVADVIDNSLTAGAQRIELLTETDSDVPAIGIVDDGAGMSRDELLEAMRPGTRNPLELRSTTDLGRFGLGLKTASFSQCRRLTVVSRRNGEASAAVWDLDKVAAADDWLIELPEVHEDVPWFDRLARDGTLVVWQKLDRLLGPESGERRNLVRQLASAAEHVEFVFHRFLSGQAGRRRVDIAINGRSLQPFDPFCSQHAATQYGAEETFLLDGHEIHIRPVTLPHHDKVSAAEWKRNGGPDGYLRNQGFYLYRNRRLIVHGTWFGLVKQTELTKLSRVRIDIPNALDAAWKIDVKKASAQPPGPVRARLRRIIDRIVTPSRRTYVRRGARLVDGNPLPVWVRTQNKNRISYGLNLDHPLFADFVTSLDAEARRRLRKLIDLVESTLPIDALFADISGHPGDVATSSLDSEDFTEIAMSLCLVLLRNGYPRDQIERMMSAAEPFRSRWSEVEHVIRDLERTETCDDTGT